jgi:hypothetical protein
MTEPIANDWKAIHDRMRQIRAEQSASFRHCPQCGGRGWIPNLSDGWRPVMVCFDICDHCHNPKDLPPPRSVPSR